MLAEKLSSEEETLKTLLANDERILHVYNQAREKKFVLEAAQDYFNSAADGAMFDDDKDDMAFPTAGGFASDEFKFEHIMGVIDSTKKQAFERMMHRVLRSLTFKMHFAECLQPGGEDAKGRALAPVQEEFLDPTSGESVNKVVFIISLRGPTIKTKVERICNAFSAVIHQVDSIAPDALESDRAGTADDISQTWGLCKGTRSKAKATMHVIAKQLVAWEWTVSSEKVRCSFLLFARMYVCVLIYSFVCLAVGVSSEKGHPGGNEQVLVLRRRRHARRRLDRQALRERGD